MHFKDCIEQWFHQYWYLVSDKVKLKRTFRMYLDASRKEYASSFYYLFNTATKTYFVWFSKKDVLNKPHDVSKFVRSRGLNYSDVDAATWPLNFMVNLSVGEFAHLDYLKVLRVGMEAKTRVRLYSDVLRQMLQNETEKKRNCLDRKCNLLKTKSLNTP